MTNTRTDRVKMICSLAMLTALALAVDFFIRLPNISGFLTYEPKDVILTIGAFIYGPIAGIAMSFIVCLVEMVTVSTKGPIGLLMNFLASGVFVGISSVIYYRRKTIPRAIIGLLAGSLSMIAIMLLWNYIITPIYQGIPRQAVLDLFPTVLIPFNAIKTGLNSSLVLLLYKGVVTALRKSKLVPERESADSDNKVMNTVILLSVSALIVATLVLTLLIFAGII